MQPWSEILKRIFLGHEQLLFGWLLGMLSPAVIEEIRRRRRLKLIEGAIAQELHELQYTMALKALAIRQRSVKLDDDFLSWLEQVLVGYKGKQPVRSFIEMVKLLRTVPVSQREHSIRKKVFT